MEKTHQYLSFNVKIFKLMNMWPSDKPNSIPQWKRWQSYYLFILTGPIPLAPFFDAITGLSDPDVDIVDEAQVLLASICIFGMFQLTICFLMNAEKVKKLVDGLSRFKKYSDVDMAKTDKFTNVFSKIFIGYTVAGIITYACIPLIFLDSCEIDKPLRMKKYNLPCGLIVTYRLPFNFTKSPMYEIILFYTTYIAFITSIIIVTITTLICGILTHVVSQLRELRKQISLIPPGNTDGVDRQIRSIIKYHTAIIGYVDEFNDAFGSQLLVHRALTAFVISILGFIILSTNKSGELLRFGMHLLGWLVLIYLVCHYGQTLINESTDVAVDMYNVEWHTKPIGVQKCVRMIIMRAQKPIVVKTMNIEALSANTFLGILSTAYSVFTLLLNVRE